MRGLLLFKLACVVSVCLTIVTLIHTDQHWRLQIIFERRRMQGSVDKTLQLLGDKNRLGAVDNDAMDKPRDFSNTMKGHHERYNQRGDIVGKLVNGVNKTVKEIGGITVSLKNETNQLHQFFTIQPDRVNPHDFRFLISNRNLCTQGPPFLFIMCLSKYSDIATRDIIRRTWASVVTSGKWPRSNETFENLKIAFILGRPDISGLSISEEVRTYNDIVMADFHDSYDNLTTKVLMGFKWIVKFCPKATYVLKVDQDTFVHIPNLISYLKSLTIPDNGLVAGRVNPRSKVYREGRWKLSWEEYPFEYYPPYLSGNTYIISGNALSHVVWIAERKPFLKIEDVFFTGIVRRIVRAEIHNRPGFTYFNQSSPKLCGFHNPVRISATQTDDRLKLELWQALHENLTDCYMHLPPLRGAAAKGRN